MTPGRLSRRDEFTPVPSHSSTFVYMIPPQKVMPTRVAPGNREHRVLRLYPPDDCFLGWLVLKAVTAVKERIKTHIEERTKSAAIWYKIGPI